ncbi:MAG: T9SS type A sorting domain-containing protein [Bacteroidota bacterium]
MPALHARRCRFLRLGRCAASGITLVLLLQLAALSQALQAQPGPVAFSPDASSEPGTEFARSVALAGDIAAFGAAFDLPGAADAGEVVLYELIEDQWTLVERPLVADRDAGDLFGAAVSLGALFGDDDDAQPSLLVGAPGRLGGGAVYHYLRDGPVWVPSRTLTPSRTDAAGFGAAVATEGVFAVVGAPQENSGAPESGAVYAYLYNPTPSEGDARFEFIGRLVTPGATPERRFGAAVALAGERFVVGVPGERVDGVPTGAVYVYRFDFDDSEQFVPVLEARLVAPGLALGFGQAVAIDGDRIVVGAPGGDDAVPGAAWLYEFDGTQWTAEQRLVVPDLPFEADYGQTVALDRDWASVAAPGGDAGGRSAGAVFLFQKRGAVWALADTLLVSSAGDGARLGTSLAMDGGRVLTGAPFADGGRGKAYLFRTSTPVATEPPGVPAAFSLSAPAPNPTRTHTTVAVDVVAPQHVRVALYDALGREVAVLHDGLVSGSASLRVGTDGLAAGVYAIRATGADGALVHRFTVVR